MIIKKGVALSNNIAIGKALIIFRDKVNIQAVKIKNVDDEIEKLNSAVVHTSKFLDQLQLLSKTYRELYDVYKMLLVDSSFIGKAVQMIKDENVNAEYALKKVTDNFMHKLSLSDNDYFKARMHDIKDIYMRLIRYMTNLSSEELDVASSDTIPIFNDFTVADIDTIINKSIKGFVSITGNKMSHKSIIVRESGIAAVTSIKNLDAVIHTGDTVIVDGFLGYLIINPDETTIEKYLKKKEDYASFIKSVKESNSSDCLTEDKEAITLYANINSNDELTHINVLGLQGIGLYRTEFLYINHGLLPEDEQCAILQNALIALKNKPLVVRTFDLGGDKISKFMPHSIEENPALGLRAIRYSLKYKDFFRSQIRAILRAGISGDIRILLPMISSIDEFLEARSIIEEEKRRLQELNIPFRDNVPIGIMIELPSTAFSIKKFVKYADFFSIGTNDLIQYTLGVDRNNEGVSYLFSPSHPTIIEILKNVYKEVTAANKQVSICGELAGDSRYIGLLIGLGYRHFSMNPRSSYIIRKTLGTLKAIDCTRLADIVLGYDTIEEIENVISAFNNKQFISD